MKVRTTPIRMLLSNFPRPRWFWGRELHSKRLELTALTSRWRSVFIRHLDCGSCNGCELELEALYNPIYDFERFGFRFEPSARHADLAACTGPFVRNLTEAAFLTLGAMPVPRIIAIGDCAVNGGIFKESYAVLNRPIEGDLVRGAYVTVELRPAPRMLVAMESNAEGDGVLGEIEGSPVRPKKIEAKIVAAVQGCPPTPEAVLKGLAEMDDIPGLVFSKANWVVGLRGRLTRLLVENGS